MAMTATSERSMPLPITTRAIATPRIPSTETLRTSDRRLSAVRKPGMNTANAASRKSENRKTMPLLRQGKDADMDFCTQQPSGSLASESHPSVRVKCHVSQRGSCSIAHAFARVCFRRLYCCCAKRRPTIALRGLRPLSRCSASRENQPHGVPPRALCKRRQPAILCGVPRTLVADVAPQLQPTFARRPQFVAMAMNMERAKVLVAARCGMGALHCVGFGQPRLEHPLPRPDQQTNTSPPMRSARLIEN